MIKNLLLDTILHDVINILKKQHPEIDSNSSDIAELLRQYLNHSHLTYAELYPYLTERLTPNEN